jgi:hypothetical protein
MTILHNALPSYDLSWPNNETSADAAADRLTVSVRQDINLAVPSPYIKKNYVYGRHKKYKAGFLFFLFTVN